MQQRLPSLRDTPVAFAHRGARAHAPENTLQSFGLALSMGATGLESDVWSTSDRHAVLDHDGVVRRRVRNVPIGSVERAALPGHIPSFDEVVSALGTGYEFSLDVKDPSAVDPLAAAVSASGFPCRRLWLCSPDLSVLRACGEALPAAHLVHSTRYERISGTLERHVSGLREKGIDTLNMHHTEWNGGRVALCHRFGVHAFGWDIQHEDHMRTALRMGLDGVYSDRVDMMMAIHREETTATRPRET